MNGGIALPNQSIAVAVNEAIGAAKRNEWWIVTEKLDRAVKLAACADRGMSLAGRLSDCWVAAKAKDVSVVQKLEAIASEMMGRQ